MTQRKCDFILTLMLGLQTAIEPDLLWKREREREKEEARRVLQAADARAAHDASPFAAIQSAVMRSFMSPDAHEPPAPTAPAAADGAPGEAGGRPTGEAAVEEGKSAEKAAAAVAGVKLRRPSSREQGPGGSASVSMSSGGGSRGCEEAGWEEAGIEHRTFQIPQLLKKIKKSSSSPSREAMGCHNIWDETHSVWGQRHSCSPLVPLLPPCLLAAAPPVPLPLLSPSPLPLPPRQAASEDRLSASPNKGEPPPPPPLWRAWFVLAPHA
jgi:hypothetical protein